MTFRRARNGHGPPRACRRGNYPIVHFQLTDLNRIAPYAKTMQSKEENPYNSLFSHHRGVPVRPNPGVGRPPASHRPPDAGPAEWNAIHPVGKQPRRKTRNPQPATGAAHNPPGAALGWARPNSGTHGNTRGRRTWHCPHPIPTTERWSPAHHPASAGRWPANSPGAATPSSSWRDPPTRWRHSPPNWPAPPSPWKCAPATCPTPRRAPNSSPNCATGRSA